MVFWKVLNNICLFDLELGVFFCIIIKGVVFTYMYVVGVDFVHTYKVVSDTFL